MRGASSSPSRSGVISYAATALRVPRHPGTAHRCHGGRPAGPGADPEGSLGCGARRARSRVCGGCAAEVMVRRPDHVGPPDDGRVLPFCAVVLVHDRKVGGPGTRCSPSPLSDPSANPNGRGRVMPRTARRDALGRSRCGAFAPAPDGRRSGRGSACARCGAGPLRDTVPGRFPGACPRFATTVYSEFPTVTRGSSMPSVACAPARRTTLMGDGVTDKQQPPEARRIRHVRDADRDRHPERSSEPNMANAPRSGGCCLSVTPSPISVVRRAGAHATDDADGRRGDP